MKAAIDNSQPQGAVTAPASKSYTIRSLFCAALSAGTSRIRNPLVADDTEAAVSVLEGLGAEVDRSGPEWTVSGGDLAAPRRKLDCRQSAATLRFLTPVCAMLPGVSHVVFDPALGRRPKKPLLDILSQLGVSSELSGTHLNIYGRGGQPASAEITLPGDISSQFISGLLLAAPLARDGLRLRLDSPAESREYIRMTIECLSRFGIAVEAGADLTEFTVKPQAYQPADYTVEGDWSSASYFLGLGALAGRITVSGLIKDSFQADRFMLNCLRSLGADVGTAGDGSLTVSRSPLNWIEADLNEAIDLLPTVACLCAAAEGRSVLSGLGRARLKESDRVAAVAENLLRMNVPVIEETDRLIIEGGHMRGAVVDAFGDHRIAMAFAMLASVCGDTVIEGAECVGKTYPGFWEDYRQAGGKVDLSE